MTRQPSPVIAAPVATHERRRSRPSADLREVRSRCGAASPNRPYVTSRSKTRCANFSCVDLPDNRVRRQGGSYASVQTLRSGNAKVISLLRPFSTASRSRHAPSSPDTVDTQDELVDANFRNSANRIMALPCPFRVGRSRRLPDWARWSAPFFRKTTVRCSGHRTRASLRAPRQLSQPGTRSAP